MQQIKLKNKGDDLEECKIGRVKKLPDINLREDLRYEVVELCRLFFSILF